MGAPHAHAHDPSPLGFTGERVLPGEPEWAWCFQAHKFGYDDLVARLPRDARVLDVGCGEGYGAAQIAGVAAFTVATDVSEEAVRHARAKYPGIHWVVADAQRLPFAPDAFDVISSLQVIEHFEDTDRHLAGIARALKPEGWHYVATPNIDLMSPEEADNEFHLRDFTAPMLHDALAERFEQVELLGMFYLEQSPRVRTLREAERTHERVQPKLARVERVLSRLPGRLRVRVRPLVRRAMGIPPTDANAARNAILASDFEARPPAEESFCLIAIARRPKS